jgi:hypothetical protein
MIKEAIDRVLALAPKTVELIRDEFGREMIVTPNGGVSVQKNQRSQPETLALNTLFGICDFIRIEGHKCSVHIEGPRHVRVITRFDDKWKIRDILAAAKISDNSFPFGRELDIESFIIAVQCHFVDTPEKKEVIDFVSSIFSSEVQTAEDDGIAQNVVMESKVGRRKEKVKMDPIVKLRPWRTFREIEQPEDTFLIRAHRQEGASLPFISLRSAGGDLWEYEAIKSINEFLRENLSEGVEVIR